jgi:hypothetical protein
MRTPLADYKYSLQLVNHRGQAVAQRDNWPLDGFYPTKTWKPGDVIEDRMGLWLPPGLAAGVYDLRIIIYSPEPGLPRLPVTTPDGNKAGHLSLGQVVIGSALTEQEVRTRSLPVDAVFDGQVALLGYASEIERNWEGNNVASLTLFWKALVTPQNDFQVFVHILSEKEEMVAQKDGPITDGAYPSSRWEVGEVVEDTRDIVLPSGFPPGQLHIRVGLYDNANLERLKISNITSNGDNTSLLLAVTR